MNRSKRGVKNMQLCCRSSRDAEDWCS